MFDKTDMRTAASALPSTARADSGRHGFWWACAVLVAGLIVTAVAARYTKREADASIKQEFDFACNEIRDKIQDRLRAHEQILRSGASFFEHAEGVTREEWRNFTECQKVEQQLPGIQGIGFSKADELLGKNMHTLIHHSRADGRHYPVDECRLFQAFREGVGVHVDDEVLWCADGSSFPAEYWSFPQWRGGKIVVQW